MKKHSIAVLTGTFLEGNGIIIWDRTTDKMKHKIIFEDTKGLYIEDEDKKYYKEDLKF